MLKYVEHCTVSYTCVAQSAAAQNMNAGIVPDWSASAQSGQSKGFYFVIGLFVCC